MNAAFLDYSTIDSRIDLEHLNQAVDHIEYYSITKPKDIYERLKNVELAIINKVVLNKQTLEKLPELKLICIAATGTNNIDLIAAKELGIVVCNVSGYSTDSVAQHVFAYLLNVMNKVCGYAQLNQTKPWNESDIFCQIDFPINQLADKTIGILGFGNLGKKVAKIADAFGMQVIISERPKQSKIRAGRVSFDEMLRTSDIISLHCPLSPETEYLFNENTFSRVKSGSIFINTARGPIVDSSSLVEALKSGQVGHAIIDVLEQEPPEKNHPLLQKDIPNLTLTHHIAWGSSQAQQVFVDAVAENIQCFKEGNRINQV